MFTLISLAPFTLWNFWSDKTLKILPWVSNGTSEILSINNVPLLDFSKTPVTILSLFSEPNNSKSKWFGSKIAPLITLNELLDLNDC